MKQIAYTECEGWLESRGIHLSDEFYPIVDILPVCLELPIPADAGPATALSYLIGDMERTTFAGGLFVLREWNLWSDGLERIRHQTISLMLGGAPLHVNEPLAIVFDSSESSCVPAFILQALLYRWDAFYVPNSATFAVFASHDALFYILPNGIDLDRNVQIQLEQLGAQSVSPPPYLSPSIPSRL